MQLRVATSQSKHKLYIGNIPKDLNKDTFKAQLDAVVKGERFCSYLSPSACSPPACLMSSKTCYSGRCCRRAHVSMRSVMLRCVPRKPPHPVHT